MPDEKGTHGHLVAFDDLDHTRHADELRLVAVHRAARFGASRPRP